MNAQPLQIELDPQTASLLQQEVAAGHFSSAADAVAHALKALQARRSAVAHLTALADEALADMDDLVDHDEVMATLDATIDRVAGDRAA